MDMVSEVEPSIKCIRVMDSTSLTMSLCNSPYPVWMKVDIHIVTQLASSPQSAQAFRLSTRESGKQEGLR